VIALGVTLLAHTWSGWCGLGFYELNQPVTSSQFVQIYLQTNIAKYLPGNVWHYYGRISAAVKAGVSGSAATLSVLLEPLLMAGRLSNGLTRYPVCSTEQPCCPSGIVNARFDYRTSWFIRFFKQGSVSRPIKAKVTKRSMAEQIPPPYLHPLAR